MNNDIYDNGENAFDIKSGRDVVIAENKIHGYVDSQGSDGTALVVQQEGGSGLDNIWILFNEFYDSELSVRAEEQVTNCYLIGNIIRDQKSSYTSIYVRTNTAEMPLIDNTIVRYNDIGFRWDDLPTIESHGNIFAFRLNQEGYEMRASTSDEDISINYNLYDDAIPMRLRFRFSVYMDLMDWVALYNVEGKLLKSGTKLDQINVEYLAAGTYLLSIVDIDTGQKIAKKIIIQ